MVFFLILLIFIVATIVLISLFALQSLPWYRPSLILEKNEMGPVKLRPVTRQPMVMEGLAEPENDFHVSLEENVARLETMLNEKNRMIEKLQKQLAAEKIHRVEFEKVKAILDEEIQNLKAQNKTLKAPTGGNNA